LDSSGFTPNLARQSNWEWLMDRSYESGTGIDALDLAVGDAERRIGPPVRKRLAIIAIPEPMAEMTNWGSDNKGRMNFNNPKSRLIACKWYVDQSLLRWAKRNPQHLGLAGFYWLAEYGEPFRDILPEVAAYVHSKGLKFYWIPSWSRSAAKDWRKLGFDYVWQQPNAFFHTEVSLSRLDEASEWSKSMNMGLEFEADRRAIDKADTFLPRANAYLDAFKRNGVETEASIAYYEAGGLFYFMARSKVPTVRSFYDELAHTILERQSKADSIVTR
jgi:hypothetical protein